MIVPRWQRRTARIVLLTFGTSMAACGGGGEQPPAMTSTVAAPPTTLPSASGMREASARNQCTFGWRGRPGVSGRMSLARIRQRSRFR